MYRSSWLLLGLFAAVALGSNRETPGQARLRSHFDSVLVELRARNVVGLSTAQRTSRDRMIRWLSEYRDAGRFPTNDRYSDQPTPIFRDASGVTCAMAYLIERSGRADIVQRIADNGNLAYIRDLSGDTSLVAWLVGSGLSLDEAARIQPAYGEENKIGERVLVAAGTVLFSGASLGISASNVFRPREGMGFVGMAIGTITVMLGGVTSHDHRAFAVANVATGGLAIVTGAYAAFRPRPPSQISMGPSKRRRAEWSPFASIDQKSRRTRAGIAAHF